MSATPLVVLYPAAALEVALAPPQVAAPDLAVLVVARRVRRGLADIAARFRSRSRGTGSPLAVLPLAAPPRARPGTGGRLGAPRGGPTLSDHRP